jgi:hypothetical protein
LKHLISKEEDFQTIDIINDYWNKQTNKEKEIQTKQSTKPTANVPRKRGRPPKYKVAYLMRFLLYLILALPLNAFEQIKFCNNNGIQS